MDISVAILAFNEESSIGGLLDAVGAARMSGHRLAEVIVYDDGSTDATAAIVAAASRRDPRIRLLRNARREGTTVGMAALARAAAGEAIVRLDADTTPGADAIERLADAIARGASVAVGANEPVLERRTVASLSAAFATSVVERLKATRYTEYYAVGRLVAYETVALRRLEFPPHIINEDHYAAIRIVRSGGNAVFEPAARCRFRVPHTFRDYWNQSRRILEGERQLERIGIERAPLRAVLAALAASASLKPLSALCWAFAYGASSVQPAPASAQPWPISGSTKGSFA